MKLSKKLLATTLLGCSVMSFSTVANASLEQFFQAYEKGDYKTAYQLAQPYKSYPMVQVIIGMMYQDGSANFPKNDKESFNWIMKAAKQNEPNGQFFLATKYYTGEGVKKDMKKAKHWFTKACNNGDKRSCRIAENEF